MPLTTETLLAYSMGIIGTLLPDAQGGSPGRFIRFVRVEQTPGEARPH